MTSRRGERDPTDVYDRLAPAVLGYFRSTGMRDPEGLTGDVFVAVVEKLDRFRGDDAALRRWVFTIAHHRRVDEIRKAARRREEPVDEAPEQPTVDVDGSVDPALLAALASLTDDQRQVVLLRYVADLPIADVARIVGRRAGAVKMLQARGLAALAGALGDSPNGEAGGIAGGA